VFSTTRGENPFSGYSKAKAALDKEIAKLRKKEGRDPMPPWTLSRDVRRTAKTLMQRAGVRPDISERVLAHAIPGVAGVYAWRSLRFQNVILHALVAASVTIRLCSFVWRMGGLELKNVAFSDQQQGNQRVSAIACGHKMPSTPTGCGTTG
jgi:hypothetical protein